ncbi:hypothetical protein WN67_15385 [Mycolicibacterium obuense]|uniref:Uncharacterized protein n=1 Tax=Mycolicibacterium obuense TaxID=1807 RepID=A0A0M2K2F9_9MYCO|nr:hypothetical protein WN67_15385 [Mycolicibacterium obuense]
MAASIVVPLIGALGLALSAPAVAEPLPYAPGTHHVVFSAFGSGEVFSIVTDPDTGLVPDHTPLPFTQAIDIGPDVTMLQVVATGRDVPGPGCSITLDDAVVAFAPIGGSGHCIYTFP